MIVMAVLIVIVALAAGYWLMRMNADTSKKPVTKSGFAAKTTAKKPVKKIENTNPYNAVTIQCKSGACEAAKNLKDKRFLTKEAPPIPLPECDVATCQCVYTRYNDRRKEEDERRDFHGLQTQLHAQTSGQERRKRRGRRKSDHAN